MKLPKIIIVDYGSQYTLLIAKAIRKLHTYSEIIQETELLPLLQQAQVDSQIYGIILSGGPRSVAETKPDRKQSPYRELLSCNLPILGICYGAQLLAQLHGAQVSPSKDREYGSTQLNLIHPEDEFSHNLPPKHTVWMSHSDSIKIPSYATGGHAIQVLELTENEVLGAFKIEDCPFYGLQFHPEVSHTPMGQVYFENFLKICQIPANSWTPNTFLHQIIPEIRKQVGTDRVLVACSGGVDSTVTMSILNCAIGDQAVGVFIDNGLLRKGEFSEVLQLYQEQLGFNVTGLDEAQAFYQRLHGLTEPEAKRKAIGNLFIEIFQNYVQQQSSQDETIPTLKWLAQGTIYPDIIESHGKIKSHHNVGGLPDQLNLSLVEPLRLLFKDEVREVGHALQIPHLILNRHPYPGPGLGIRILGEITPEKVKILQEADSIFMNHLKLSGKYEAVWQAGVILLDSLSVGVMGDNRTYESVVALRAVCSQNGMTAQVAPLSIDFLTRVSTEIVNQVRGVNRVVYDVTTKPPGTIEWE